jgi:hypothetical protein
VVKAGVCKTPIGGSNPPVASNNSNTKAAYIGPLSLILTSFDSKTDSKTLGTSL